MGIKKLEEILEWEVPVAILKAHLIEEIEDGYGEAEVTIDNSTSYYNRRNLDELFDLIDTLDIKVIQINTYKEVDIVLNDDSVVYMEF